ncbi:MAG TPA: DUF6398 domain-containing protein [Stellaceae bacterium]|nr:DUF6398 domain-containing protein [Stellaceae bacterium]
MIEPSPVVSGQATTWACGVLYALGQANFLTDKSSKPSMSMQALCASFAVGLSTGGNKAKVVRDALGIKRWDHRWLLPSRLDSMPMVWMVDFDGFAVDARGLPRWFRGRRPRSAAPAPDCRVRARRNSICSGRWAGRGWRHSQTIEHSEREKASVARQIEDAGACAAGADIDADRDVCHGDPSCFTRGRWLDQRPASKRWNSARVA